MAFLQRLAASFKEGLETFTIGGEIPRRNEAPPRTLNKQSSKGKSRPSSASFGFLEAHTRDAIAAFVQDKFDKGEAKPHVFTQFWLQFPKLEAGFGVLRQQLQNRTGSWEGPLPLAILQSSPEDFGIEQTSLVLRELCSKAASHKCAEIDFIGMVMLLLVVHLTELSTPAAEDSSSLLHPDVRTMLSCLELAFTHFNSARKGKLDKREVAEALQYESAKAHMKEGTRGRTSNRLAHRLFEGLDWEHDNTISFENFLRGILQLVQDEFGDEDEDDDQDDLVVASAAAANAGSGCVTPSPPGELADGASLGGGASGAGTRSSTGQPRCGSSLARSSSNQQEGNCGRGRQRSSSATGMTGAAAGPGTGTTPGAAPSPGQRQGHGQGQLRSGSVGRSPNGFLASLRGSFRKSTDMLKGMELAAKPTTAVDAATASADA